MKAKIKKLWVEALESGKYKQARETLYVKNTGFCCLGVLCDLHRKSTKKKKYSWNPLGSSNKHLYGITEAIDSLPDVVMNWAGLEQSNPNITVNGMETTLAQENDSGKTFKEIAKIIKKQL
jgi:hypothetical protein